MRIRHLPWAIALVCVVLGFMLSTQFKVQKAVQTNDGIAFQRNQELVQQLQQAESERDSLMTELEKLRTQLRALASNQQEYSELAEQLELAQVQAGLIPVSGPGIIITMNDSSKPLAPGENPNAGLIHDEDVLKVINELAAAGAEAISINEQRLVAGSEIRCTGPTITINGVRTAPPIRIKAVGNADELETVMNMRNGPVENLRPWGIQVLVQKEQSLTVPAFKGSLTLQYGVPAEEVAQP